MSFRKILINFITLSILFSLVYFIYIGIIKSKEPVIKDKESTIAILARKDIIGPKRRLYFEYHVDSHLYTISISKSYNEVIGDKFEIIYEKFSPEKAKILFYKPIFLDNENTLVVEGYISDFIKIGRCHQLEYTYTINGNLYKQWQVLLPDYNILYPVLKKGDKFKVKVWVNNPQRSVLLYNEK